MVRRKRMSDIQFVDLNSIGERTRNRKEALKFFKNRQKFMKGFKKTVVVGTRKSKNGFQEVLFVRKR